MRSSGSWASAYQASHLPGAVSLPLARVPALARELLDPSRAVITYCHDTLCDLSPRAAWRLESLGFDEVYDYVGSKEDWLGAGLPFKGADADEPRLGTLATPDVPTCTTGERAAEARGRLGDGDVCLVVNEARIVRGVVLAEDLATGAEREVEELMHEAPRACRPHIAVLPELQQPRHVEQVSTLVRPDDVAAAVDLGPDPKVHLRAIGAGQEGFLRFYGRDVLPHLGRTA